MMTSIYIYATTAFFALLLAGSLRAPRSDTFVVWTFVFWTVIGVVISTLRAVGYL